MYIFNAKEVKDKCVEWIRNWFAENGNGCNAVIGISGGKDSSVVAALCCEALGKDRVIGVLMPDGEQKDIADSMQLVEHLGIKYYIMNIAEAVCGIRNQIYNTDISVTSQTTINLPPRIRMAMLYAVSQSMNGRVANTCNLSEDYVGYATKYGDAAGDFSPLSQLTVTEVRAIGEELGLPHNLIYKTPSDGLCGQSDEDKLGFTYAELDLYLREGVVPAADKLEKITTLHRQNLFKLQPMASFKYE